MCISACIASRSKIAKLFYVFFIVSGSSGNLLCFCHHHIFKINEKKRWQNQYAQLSITCDKAKCRFYRGKRKGKYFFLAFFSNFQIRTHTENKKDFTHILYFVSRKSSRWKFTMEMKNWNKESAREMKKNGARKRSSKLMCFSFFCFHHNFLVDQEIAKDKMGNHILCLSFGATSGKNHMKFYALLDF